MSAGQRDRREPSLPLIPYGIWSIPLRAVAALIKSFARLFSTRLFSISFATAVLRQCPCVCLVTEEISTNKSQ